jgi:UDP-glucose 4-epimerase
MRVVVTGASGNMGTSVLRSLGGDPRVESIVGLARRRPSIKLPRTSWVQADVVHSDLTDAFRGADAVIHLAWLIQPSRDGATLDAVNVEGSARVFHAAGAAGVPRLLYASSIGAYSEGPKDRRVDESWPTDGIPSAYYSRQKAAVERRLDRFEAAHPEVRVVRLRPGLVFKRDAASEIRRFFAGPFLPNPLVNRDFIPAIPAMRRLVFQAVHSHDVGEAFRLAMSNDDARGPFNIAAEPVLDPATLGRTLGARPVRTPAGLVRGVAALTWRLRLQPTAPSWLDMALGVPIMDTTKARDVLGWKPRHGADDALLELLDGMRDGAGFDTPPLAIDAGGPMRVREVLTGVGARSGA